MGFGWRICINKIAQLVDLSAELVLTELAAAAAAASQVSTGKRRREWEGGQDGDEDEI